MSIRTLRSALASVARGSVRRLAPRVARNARLKRLARLVLDRFPALQVRVHAWIHRTAELPPRRRHVPEDHADLSPDAHRIYSELKQHFDARKP